MWHPEFPEMKADVVIVALLTLLNGGNSKYLQARCFVPNSRLTSSVLPEASCLASLSLKPWSQKCRLKTFTNCCAVPVFDWLKLQWLPFNQHHHKVSTGRCAVPQAQGHETSNLSIAVHWGSCALGVFSMGVLLPHVGPVRAAQRPVLTLQREIIRLGF